tara:strand:- start:37 stop:165 length:129 start_codon:yes stop_codon:yes gene_type:complete
MAKIIGGLGHRPTSKLADLEDQLEAKAQDEAQKIEKARKHGL